MKPKQLFLQKLQVDLPGVECSTLESSVKKKIEKKILCMTAICKKHLPGVEY